MHASTAYPGPNLLLLDFEPCYIISGYYLWDQVLMKRQLTECPVQILCNRCQHLISCHWNNSSAISCISSILQRIYEYEWTHKFTHNWLWCHTSEANKSYADELCSGIALGRVLNLKVIKLMQVRYLVWYIASCSSTSSLHNTEILEVNLFAFVYRLFHEDFSSIVRIRTALVPTIETILLN